MTRCPICSKPLRELEHVRATHTPASVPEQHRGSPLYSFIQSYVVVQCEKGHRMHNSNGRIESCELVWGDR